MLSSIIIILVLSLLSYTLSLLPTSSLLSLKTTSLKSITKSTTSLSSTKKLVLWDCDGVLVDSEALLKQGEVEALQKLGYSSITVNDCVRLFSGINKNIIIINYILLLLLSII